METINFESIDDVLNSIVEACKYGGIGALIGFLVIPAILIVLCFMGFCFTGVVAGSYAALTQSSIGNVGTGSCFSGLQKIAMNKGTLYAIPILTVVGFIIGVIVYIV